MVGILIQKGSSAEKEVEELSRIEAEKMAKDGVEKIAEMYWKKFSINEFWVAFYGKQDRISNKINIATRMYTAKTKPKTRMMGCQLWHFIMSAGVKELEWILPLEDRDQTKSYTKGNSLIRRSLYETEKLLGMPITSRPR